MVLANGHWSLINTASHKVSIEGPFCSKKIAGVLIARCERVSHVTYFQKDTIPMRDPVSVRLALEFPISNVCSMNGPGNFLNYNVRLTV